MLERSTDVLNKNVADDSDLQPQVPPPLPPLSKSAHFESLLPMGRPAAFLPSYIAKDGSHELYLPLM